MGVLPKAFLERMETQLGAEFPAFKTALEGPRSNAIRVNTLKITPARLEELLKLTLEPVPWSASGFYVSHTDQLGSHALHHAGAFYMQESSAQVVAASLTAQSGERVLDLCAAPGGKSTHLAALMGNTGVLVCNEPAPNRARVLQENLERIGSHAIVTQEDPTRLAAAWGGFFDRVLVDAPCSGEGMFRKSLAAVRDWSPAHVLACSKRQAQILESAAELLKVGGTLVYSTCTFAPEENEDAIARFLESHPEFRLEVIAGLPAGMDGIGSRLMPHLVRGEGHFVARLRKISGEDGDAPLEEPDAEPFERGHALLKAWLEFCRRFPVSDDEGYMVFRDEIQRVALDTPRLAGLKVLRAGVGIAHLQKDRLEPHHAYSHLEPTQFDAGLNLDLTDPRVSAYLRGESLESEGDAGWLPVRVAGLALGWGKRVGHTVKNHYPKSLRGFSSAATEE